MTMPGNISKPYVRRSERASPAAVRLPIILRRHSTFHRGQGNPVEKPCSGTVWQRPCSSPSSRRGTLSDRNTRHGKHAFKARSRRRLCPLRVSSIPTQFPGKYCSRPTRVQRSSVPRPIPRFPRSLLVRFQRPRRVRPCLSFSGGACPAIVHVRLTKRARRRTPT